MGDKTGIEWTEQSLFGVALPRRCRVCGQTKAVSEFKADRSRPDGHAYVCRLCERVTPLNIPNAEERQIGRLQGKQWCRECKAWLSVGLVTGRGRCKAHQRDADRERYARDEVYRSERRQHAHARKRGIDPVPPEGQESLLHEFDGLCAYCNSAPADTWDHVVAVSKGGQTTPDNILPACMSCNSSKGARDIWEWIDRTGRTPNFKAIERLAHYQVIG